METSSMEMLAALTGAQASQLRPGEVTPVWLSYEVRSGPKLWRLERGDNIRGGVLMARDRDLTRLGDGAPCCGQAVRECRARGAEGFWANWTTCPTPALEAFTRQLEEALHQAQLSLYVNEAYARSGTLARVMISSALSGGTLEQRLRRALKEWGAERVVLAVEPMAEEFTLPAPTGNGRKLSERQLSQLRERTGAVVHRSQELCESYFTYQQGEETRLVLFDTPADVDAKLALARRLGLRRVMVPLGGGAAPSTPAGALPQTPPKGAL